MSSQTSSAMLPPTDEDRPASPARLTPPKILGPTLMVLPPAALWAATALGLDIIGAPFTGAMLAMGAGLVESARTLTTMNLARRGRAAGVVVRRGLLRGIELVLPLPGATAVMAQVLFAATNDLIWRVTLPRPVDVSTFSVMTSSILRRSTISTGDKRFDEAYVIDGVDAADAVSVQARLDPATRAALHGLFATGVVRRVRFTTTGVELELPRRGTDCGPVLRVLPALRPLADALNARPQLPAGAFRGRSPDGGSTSF